MTSPYILDSSLEYTRSAQEICKIIMHDMKLKFAAIGWNISDSNWTIYSAEKSEHFKVEPNKENIKDIFNQYRCSIYKFISALSFSSPDDLYFYFICDHDVDNSTVCNSPINKNADDKSNNSLFDDIENVNTLYKIEEDCTSSNFSVKSIPYTYIYNIRLAIERSYMSEFMKESNVYKNLIAEDITYAIRNPLNEIVKSLQNLNGHLDDGKIQEFSKNISNLSNNIIDVVDLINIETKSINLFIEKVLLSTIIKESVETAKSIASKKINDCKITIVLECNDIELCCDIKRVKQVLINLLTNALIYSNGKDVLIQIYYDLIVNKEFDGDFYYEVEFTVSDGGPGISKEQYESIFTPRTLGAKTGLRISHMLAKLLGGDLILSESSPSTGTVFKFKTVMRAQINHSTLYDTIHLLSGRKLAVVGTKHKKMILSFLKAYKVNYTFVSSKEEFNLLYSNTEFDIVIHTDQFQDEIRLKKQITNKIKKLT